MNTHISFIKNIFLFTNPALLHQKSFLINLGDRQTDWNIWFVPSENVGRGSDDDDVILDLPVLPLSIFWMWNHLFDDRTFAFEESPHLQREHGRIVETQWKRTELKRLLRLLIKTIQYKLSNTNYLIQTIWYKIFNAKYLMQNIWYKLSRSLLPNWFQTVCSVVIDQYNK